jgi:fructose-1-phosphate kinase PfkB-like protein
LTLTVTPNPSLDVLFSAERLVWEDANRIPQPRRRPGGQGINVVRAIGALSPGSPALACALLGGPTGRELQERLEAEGTPIRAVPVSGETRVFVGVRESETGRSLLLNPRGPGVTAGETEALLAAIEEELSSAGRRPGGGRHAADHADHAGRTAAPGHGRDWVVACGSLPPGMPTDFYASVGRLAHDHGARFVPDCDGEALAAAAPLADLLVPNDMEAERLIGRPVASAVEAAAAGSELVAAGATRVVMTLGDRGAVSVTAEGSWWAKPALPAELAEETAEGTAVGAGDAFLAALLLGPDGEEPEGLVRAVAAGTAVLLGRGAELVTAEDAARVRPHVRVDRP